MEEYPTNRTFARTSALFLMWNDMIGDCLIEQVDLRWDVGHMLTSVVLVAVVWDMKIVVKRSNFSCRGFSGSGFLELEGEVRELRCENCSFSSLYVNDSSLLASGGIVVNAGIDIINCIYCDFVELDVGILFTLKLRFDQEIMTVENSSFIDCKRSCVSYSKIMGLNSVFRRCAFIEKLINGTDAFLEGGAPARGIVLSILKCCFQPILISRYVMKTDGSLQLTTSRNCWPYNFYYETCLATLKSWTHLIPDVYGCGNCSIIWYIPPPTVNFSMSEFFMPIDAPFSESGMGFGVTEYFSSTKAIRSSEAMPRTEVGFGLKEGRTERFGRTEIYSDSQGKFSRTGAGFSRTARLSSTRKLSLSAAIPSSETFVRTSFFSKTLLFTVTTVGFGLKGGKTGQFSKTKWFISTRRISKSRSFGPSGKFSKTKPWSKTPPPFSSTQRYSASGPLTSTKRIQSTRRFTKSRNMSKSKGFGKTQPFRKTFVMSETAFFSSTSRFTMSCSLTRSKVMTVSKKFTSSRRFLSSRRLSATPKLGRTVHMSKTQLWSGSMTITRSGMFTESAKFGNSTRFGDSYAFTKTYELSDTVEFSGTEEWSSTGLLSSTLKLTLSRTITDGVDPTPSITFSVSSIFRESVFFWSSPYNESDAFQPSEPLFSSVEQFGSTASLSVTGSLRVSGVFWESMFFWSSPYNESDAFRPSEPLVSSVEQFGSTESLGVSDSWRVSESFESTIRMSPSNAILSTERGSGLNGERTKSFSRSSLFGTTDFVFLETISFNCTEIFSVTPEISDDWKPQTDGGGGGGGGGDDGYDWTNKSLNSTENLSMSHLFYGGKSDGFTLDVSSEVYPGFASDESSSSLFDNWRESIESGYFGITPAFGYSQVFDDKKYSLGDSFLSEDFHNLRSQETEVWSFELGESGTWKVSSNELAQNESTGAAKYHSVSFSPTNRFSQTSIFGKTGEFQFNFSGKNIFLPTEFPFTAGGAGRKVRLEAALPYGYIAGIVSLVSVGTVFLAYDLILENRLVMKKMGLKDVFRGEEPDSDGSGSLPRLENEDEASAVGQPEEGTGPSPEENDVFMLD
jgi:hypothetical protein